MTLGLLSARHTRHLYVDVLLIAAALAQVSSSCLAASFDCGRARNRIEHIICSTPEISQLDDQLAALFRKARQSSSTPGIVLKEEQRWLGKRNQCADQACVVRSDNTRIGELKKLDNPAQPVETAVGAPAAVAAAELPVAVTSAAPSIANQQTTSPRTPPPSGTAESAKRRNDTQELAESAKQALRQAIEEGPSVAAEAGVDWTLSTKTDEMTDGAVMTALSTQFSEDKSVAAEVKIMCDAATKSFKMTALFVNGGDESKAVSLLREDRHSHSASIEARFNTRPPSDNFLVQLGDFSNEIILTVAPSAFDVVTQAPHAMDFIAISKVYPSTNEADFLQYFTRILYKVKTSNGDITIKVTPYDENVLQVAKACATTPT